MREWSILLAGALLVGQGLAELAAMHQTGSLRRRWKPEWTFRAVNLPYRLMFAVGIVQRYFSRTDPATAMVVAGAAIASAGILLRVVCHYQLGFHFSPYVELADEHQLTERGLYRYVRHPMYLGTLLVLVGVPILLASWWSAAFAVLALAGLWFRIAKEERLLRERLAGYAAYAKRTWRLVPGVW